MAGPQTTLLIEGGFRELVEELADYIDNVKKSQGDAASSSLRSAVTASLDRYTAAEESQNTVELEAARDEVLKIIVGRSEALNAIPDKGEGCQLKVRKHASAADGRAAQNSLLPTIFSFISSSSRRT